MIHLIEGRALPRPTPGTSRRPCSRGARRVKGDSSGLTVSVTTSDGSLLGRQLRRSPENDGAVLLFQT